MSRLFTIAVGLLGCTTGAAIITAFIYPAMGCLASIILIGATLLCAIIIIWSVQR